MHLFASHFGYYEVGPGPVLKPFRHDPDPSPVGLAYLDLARHPARILQPMVRRGWLNGDGGAARGEDLYEPLTADQAAELVSAELRRVRTEYGNQGIFGGSYGWASAGRFHHAQSQLKRFLNCAGGFVSARNTYSYGTAKVLIPHVLGQEFSEPDGLCPSWDQICANAKFFLAFGGLRRSNAQVEAGGTGQHHVAGWIKTFRDAGGEMLTLSPDASDAPAGRHMFIKPGSDTAAMLAMAKTLLDENLADMRFLERCTMGAEHFIAYLHGRTDGIAKTAEWAAGATGIAAEDLKALARRLAASPSLINLSWSLQRARFGEQPYWAAIALAACVGQMGQPGTGLALGLGAVSSCGQPNRRLRGPSLPQGHNAVAEFIPVARITDMLERPGDELAYNGEKIRLPAIRLVWWAGGNPFHHHQDLNRLARAWKRPDTVIVLDNVWTATARHADIVLPSAMPFERNDIAASSRDNWIAFSKQVLPPPEGVETDHQVLARIAEKLGFRAQFTENLDELGWLRRLYAGYRTEFPELPDWDAFREAGFARLDPDETAPVPAVPLAEFVKEPDHFPLSTPSGRIELYSEVIAGMHYDDCPAHPAFLEEPRGTADALSLTLLSPQPATRLHSQLDGAAPARDSRRDGIEPIRVHPSDILAAGLQDGEIVEARNERGAVIVRVMADSNLMPGTASLPTGGWYRPVKDKDGSPIDLGGNPNTLTADCGSSRLSQGASANHPRIRLQPIDPATLTARQEAEQFHA